MSRLPITDDLNFHYLLGLMPPLHNVPEFAWLPELFSIVGYETLIKLCKYAGGETIKIPTVEQLSESIDALQWFYDTEITKLRKPEEIPASVLQLVLKIRAVYSDADNS